MTVALVIKASSGRTVDRLIDDLWTGDAVARDTAVARLTVIGERALQRLLDLAAAADAPGEARAAAFRALESMASPKALDLALEAMLGTDAVVAMAAAGVARAHVHTPRGIAAIDRLTAVALAEDQPTPVRAAAARALSELDPTTIQPVVEALVASSNPVVAAEAVRPVSAAAAPSSEEILREASAGELPDSAEVLRQALAAAAPLMPAEALGAVIEQVRVREGAESTERRAAWRAARAAAHLALAVQGSRLALFDLRETLERSKEPQPAEFLTALLEIGDASCLDAVAMADAGAAAAGLPADDWWRQQLAGTFRAIAAREGITRRHQAARRIEKKWPGAFQRLNQAPGGILQ